MGSKPQPRMTYPAGKEGPCYEGWRDLERSRAGLDRLPDPDGKPAHGRAATEDEAAAFQHWHRGVRDCSAFYAQSYGDPRKSPRRFRWLAGRLEAAGVPDAVREAEEFVQGNPGIEAEMTAAPRKSLRDFAEAAEEWLDAYGDALGWQEPARYGAS